MLRYTLYPVTPDERLCVQFSFTEWAEVAAAMVLNDAVSEVAGDAEPLTATENFQVPLLIPSAMQRLGTFFGTGFFATASTSKLIVTYNLWNLWADMVACAGSGFLLFVRGPQTPI